MKESTLSVLVVVFAISALVMLILYVQKQRDYRKLLAKILKDNNKRLEVFEKLDYSKNISADVTDEKVLQNMRKLFEEDKIYLDSDLNMKKLTRKIGTNRTTLSHAINTNFGKTFPALLREYRVQEAINLMGNSKYNNYTIEVISNMSGFKNRQVFYRVFKRITGVTPNYYRQILNIENHSKFEQDKN